MTVAVETLRALLSYDPETGRLFWKVRAPEMFAGGKYAPERTCATWNTTWAGREAFTCVSADGYRNGMVLKKSHLAHRVIYALAHGYWPAHQVDHINGVRDDNRLCNLREATPAENCRNARRYSSNTSGIKGVRWNPKEKRWTAQISVDRRRIHIGYFRDRDSAAAAYAEASARFHGEFGRLA